MSWVRRSYVRFVSVKSRPNDDAEVTSRSWPAGSLMSQTYGWCVCPEMTMSMAGSRSLAIGMIGESLVELGGSPDPLPQHGVVVAVLQAGGRIAVFGPPGYVAVRFGRAALVDEDDDGVDALCAQHGHQGVGGLAPRR